ncbi:MAG: hypothetical protein ABJ000_07440 [Saccharospirillum sp.]|uniref:hypothetical protein n=1 Tax=Saccharospirillum sp. TaxID=2033801 RepID=UPI00329A71F1
MKPRKHLSAFWRMLTLRLCNVEKATPRLVKKRLPVIANLTTIEPRLSFVHVAINSMLLQEEAPERVILWLDERLQGKIPAKLTRLTQKAPFEIRFRKDVGPHTKLVHALADFPDRLLFTGDDDMMYHPTTLARLYKDHQTHPTDIISHACRRIRRNDEGTLLPYKQWRYEKPGEHHPDTLLLGFGGVLYPPGALPQAATDEALFKQLAPKADDLWFKAISANQGTTVRRASQPLKPQKIPFSQKVALRKANVGQDTNRQQWQALSEHFKLEI